MNKLARAFIEEQIDNLSELLIDDRALTVYDWELKDLEGNKPKLDVETTKRLFDQNCKCNSLFRDIKTTRDRLQILLDETPWK